MNDFTGWLPIRIYADAQGDQVDWLRIGKQLLPGPFFAEDIQQLIGTQPFHQLFRRQTPLATLLEWGEAPRGEAPRGAEPGRASAPAGLIFHGSRCGSTLAVRLLQEEAGTAVLSEPTVLNRILQGLAQDHPAQRAHRLRVVRALVAAWTRTWPDRRLFIKLDAADSAHLEDLAALWPGVPACFMYRDPVETLVSQTRQRAPFTLAGIFGYNPLGMPIEDAVRLPGNEYCARVLGITLQRGAKGCAAGYARPLRYQPDSTRLRQQLATLFGLSARAAGEGAYARHAKYPGQMFSDDRAAKQAAADDELRTLAARWMQPAVDQLDALAGLSPAAPSIP